MRENIQKAIGKAWEQIKLEHPQQAADLEAKFNYPTNAIAHQLNKDEAYQALLAKTDAETSIPELVKSLLPMVLSAITAIMA